MNSPFDAFAWFYHRYWAAPFAEWQKPALDGLLFTAVPSGARILDLCCGVGTLARQLISTGYEVIGVDSSAAMLEIARNNAPQASFIKAGATDFALPEPVDAAVCAFDSLNNLLEPPQMESAFRQVHAALRASGCFLFDVNTSAAYGERWGHTFSEVQPDHAFFLRGGFDPQARIGHTKVTMFRLFDGWERSDTEIRQRPWEIAEVEPMMRSAGFSEISAYRAIEDLGMAGHYGIGRVYFRARKGAG